MNPKLPPTPRAQERKELLAGGFKDKHTAMGSVLLAVGVGIAIEGCANTYMRTGKLFPGPHLYAGGWCGKGNLGGGGARAAGSLLTGPLFKAVACVSQAQGC